MCKGQPGTLTRGKRASPKQAFVRVALCGSLYSIPALRTDPSPHVTVPTHMRNQPHHAHTQARRRARLVDAMNAKRAAAFEAASLAAARAAPASSSSSSNSAANSSDQYPARHSNHHQQHAGLVGGASARSTVVGNGHLHYRRGERTFANQWLDDHTPGHSLRIFVGALGELFDTLTS